MLPKEQLIETGVGSSVSDRYDRGHELANNMYSQTQTDRTVIWWRAAS